MKSLAKAVCSVIGLLVLSSLITVDSFAPRTASNTLARPASCRGRSKSWVLLGMSQNPFDVSKPVFDLFSIRSIRGDALLQYSSLNQSEPLRINLYGLLAVTLFSAPLISEAVGGETMGLVGTAGSTLAGFISVGLFVRECRKRTNQLSRIEKELNSEQLQIRLAANALADKPYGQPQSLLSLKRSSTPPRIIALCGTSTQLRENLKLLRVFGRCLTQSSAYVVPVPVDGSKRSDWGLAEKGATYPWLAEAFNTNEWIGYFNELSEGEFRWFGLNSNGRSFGSGAGDSPEWLQMLGQYLRPKDMWFEEDKDDTALARNEKASVVVNSQKGVL